MTTDVKIVNSKGYYDIEWTDSGDISMIESLDTAILMSLFEEVRASSTEIPESDRRRGWIGNETTPDFEQGNKAWMFEQERVTGSVLAELGVVVNNGLQWLIGDEIAVNTAVEQPFLNAGKVCANINLFRGGSPVDRRFYAIWDNTGNF